MKRVLFLGIFVYFIIQLTFSYLPVFVFHGIKGFAYQYQKLVDNIEKYQPGVKVHNIGGAEGFSSVFSNLNEQYEKFRLEVESIKKQYPENQKFHLIAHSQGGLISRKYIETNPNHNIENFVLLSSPQMGQYGLTPEFETTFPILWNKTREEVYLILYTKFAQKRFSVSDYWKDPNHKELYYENVKYLTELNNEVKHKNYEFQRNNFIKIKKLCAFTSPQDEVIEPYQSALFKFWKFGKNIKQKDLKMEDMKYKKIYKGIGIDQIEKRGDLILKLVNNVLHQDWVNREDIFKNYTLKCLN